MIHSRKHWLLFFAPAIMCIICSHPVSAQFVQQGSKLVGADTSNPAQQGRVSLSADGNTAIVGGLTDSSNVGAAWVYTRSGGVWAEQGSKLVGTDASGFANQGISVSLSADGNTALVGGWSDSSGVGAAWVFTRSGGVWTQQGSKLVGTGAAGPAYQGRSVSLSADGNTAIVGGFTDSSYVGAAWVYTRSGGVWSQQGSKLVGTGASGTAYQGTSVSLSADGNTAMVGGYVDSSGVGAAWIYTRSGGVWSQQGSKLVGTGASGTAFQGISVSLSADGNTAMEGGPGDSSFVGAAWVFTRSGGVWSQQGSKLVGTGASGGSYQGYSASLSADGNTAMVGGPGDSSFVGAAWVFTRSGGVWSQLGNKLVGTDAVGAANQGAFVALSADGNTAIAGAPADSNNAGAAWVFVRSVVDIEFAVQNNWNMVSVPLEASDFAKSTLFPTAVSTAFTYEGGYVTYDTLEHGRGYWLKFDSAQTISQSGLERTWDTVEVQDGWNMVGSLNVGIPAASLSSIPGGLITSPFYEYTGVYAEATTLEPGRGYWVKVSGAGQIVMTSEGSMPQATRIRIMDRGERPPAPPEGELPNPRAQTPGRFMLGQNYPNPFNPVTNIRYSLASAEYVHLAVYDILGREVAVLVNGTQEAGYKSVAFDAGNLPSGVYTYRITAGSFTDVKRMMVVK